MSVHGKRPASHRARHRPRVKPGTAQAVGQVRIIGGQWRGRRLPVPVVPGLRPTGDRVRETLFNWLHGVIDGAHCLDLFAGTGVLGLEALSRGAERLLLVEPDPQAADSLAAQVEILQAGSRTRLLREPAERVLETLVDGQDTAFAGPFDLVFLDPPFAQQRQRTCLQVMRRGLLSPAARVYVEAPAGLFKPETDPPPGYECLRCKRFGEVEALLLVAVQENPV